MKDFIKYILIILLLMFLIPFSLWKVTKIGTSHSQIIEIVNTSN